MMAQFKAVMERTEASRDKTYARTKGYVHVGHTFDPPDTKIPSQMALVLAPTGTNEKETQLKMNPFLPDQETGAIVPKKYDVSLCALGFKTEPDKITLDIGPGKIAEARFVLKPQGMVAGFITATVSADDTFWGFDKDLPAHVKIRAITLTGTGVQRKLLPVDTLRDREELAIFLSSKDYASKNHFAFFDVPGGEYDLEIDATGCKPFSTKIKAEPGEFVVPPPFRMILQ
jgi:hypothetical protein